MALSLVRCLRPVRSVQPLSHYWSSLNPTKTKQSAVRFISSQTIKEPSLPVKSVLKFKSRPVKKKPARPSSGLEEWSVVGYSAAESFDLFGIQDALREQQLYSRVRSLSLQSSLLLTTFLTRWSCPRSWTRPAFMCRKSRTLKRGEEILCSSRRAVSSSGMFLS